MLTSKREGLKKVYGTVKLLLQTIGKGLFFSLFCRNICHPAQASMHG